MAILSAADILGLSARMSAADTFDDILKMTPDDIPFLTAADLCRVSGVKHARRAGWADLGYVRKEGRGKNYSTTDAAELVAFHELVSALDFEDAVLVWESVREPLRAAMPLEGAKLILVDVHAGEGRLVRVLTDVGPTVRLGHPFVLLDLSDAIDRAVEVCRRRQHVREPGSPKPVAKGATVHRIGKP